MAESTTANDTTTEGASALPEVGTQDAAEQTTSEATGTVSTESVAEQPTSESQEGDQASLPQSNDTDEKLKSFAKGQGIDDVSELTEREKSLLKAAYDNKAAADRNFQRTSALEKDLGSKSDEIAEEVAAQTGENPEVLKRLQRMEVKEAVRDFWNTPDSNGNLPDRSLEAPMVELLQQRPHLANDLKALYATAVFESGGFNSAKSQGKREALESLAHKQQAAVPTGSATNPGTAPKEKPFEELSIAEMENKLGFARR